MRLSSQIVHVGLCTDQKTGAVSTPIYQSATFRHPALGESTGFDYSRTLNPTRQVLEEGIALLEEGAGGFAFSSGMAAVTAVLMQFQSGDHLVVAADCYGGTYRLLDKIFDRFGLRTSFVDCSDLDEVIAAVESGTKAIIIETPTNPVMRIADIRAIVQLARPKGIQTIVDNTFLTPYFQKPLTLGADLVIHSGTKYLAGHNDVLCGFVVAREKNVAEIIGFIQNSTGGVLSPADSWLVIRGLKTLALRMEKHNSNALKVAEWLAIHPKVRQVHFPGLKGHPGKKIHDAQATGYGGMLSFIVSDAELVPQVLRRVKVLKFAESLGGVESLITFPAVQTHADVPTDVRDQLGINDALLRLSVGIEAVEDIIEDLAQALE
jgi:cystathionine gamma-synthase